jgi:NTE family protein
MTASVPTPDVIVLGGGGILGEAWMSAILTGLDEAEGFDARAARRFVGTSAGSIVATSLAAGERPGARLGRLPEQPAEATSPHGDGPTSLRQALGAAAGIGGAAAAPLASLALGSTARGGALVRRIALARVPAGRRSLAGLGSTIEAAGVRFDGRLLISAVELETGRRVMFGAPGAPDASVADAVQASCAIPGVFRPVRVNGRSYVDGGAWSPTNVDAAGARRGDHVLCLNPTGSFRPTPGDPAGVFGPVSRGIAATEALALRRRGATVDTVNPDEATAAVMGTKLMDPRRRDDVIAAGLNQGRRLAAGRGLRAA